MTIHSSQSTAPRLVDAHAKVFSALRHRGFRESEVKAVLAELRGQVELDGASLERYFAKASAELNTWPGEETGKPKHEDDDSHLEVRSRE